MPASVASIGAICAASAAPSAARVSTSSAAPRGPTARIASGRPGLPSTERSAARSASSTAATGALFKRVTARQAVSRSSNRISALALFGVLRDRAIGDLADESERAFGADHEVREDVDRVGEVDQRVEAVAGGVLHPELVPDARGQRFVGARRRGRARRARARGRACRARNAARLAASRVSSTVPSASTTRSAGERPVAVLRRAAAHAARVVGGDAADHRGVDRRRIGADLAAEAGEPAIGDGADDARLQRDRLGRRRPTSQRRQLSPSSISTESVTAWPDRLVPAARNVTGVPSLAHCGEQPHYLVFAFDDDRDLGHEPVEARVGAPGQQAQRIGDEARIRNEFGQRLLQSPIGFDRHVAPLRKRAPFGRPMHRQRRKLRWGPPAGLDLCHAILRNGSGSLG